MKTSKFAEMPVSLLITGVFPIVKSEGPTPSPLPPEDPDDEEDEE